jgi:hypothetical protein
MGETKFSGHNSREHVSIVGNVKNYSDGKVIILIIGDNEKSVFVSPRDDGYFSQQILIDNTFEPGFHSIIAKHDNKIIGIDEILIEDSNSISINPGVTEVHVTRDSMINSGGSVALSLKGEIPNAPASNLQLLDVVVISPDGTSQSFKITPHQLGTFSHKLWITDLFEIGEYEIIYKYENNEISSLSMFIDPVSEKWIQTHTERWLYGEISEKQYVKKLQEMTKGLIHIKNIHNSNNSLPGWFENAAYSWVDGKTDFDSIKNTLQYLVNTGILW